MTIDDATAAPDTRWFPTSGRTVHNRSASLLICLPYAGGGTSVFREWVTRFPPHVTIAPLLLPGRESRFAEPPDIDVSEVADAVTGHATRAGQPYAIYGHSLGALIGFETIRELRRRGATLPDRFLVGACHPPHIRDSLAELGHATDADFVAGIREIGGSLPEALAHPELRELVMPALRGDFAWLARRRHEPDAPLPVPIVGFAGSRDPVVTAPQMADWASHTDHGFELHTVDGDHFFLEQAVDQVVACLAGPAPRPQHTGRRG